MGVAECPSGSGAATSSCHDGAPAIGVPYQPTLCPSSGPASAHVLTTTSARPVVAMNRSWSWQMQSHRNYLRLSDTVYSADRSFQHPSSNTTTMDPTTLVTFLFKAPPEARTVELLGSWDNFTHPYLMEHDRRRGTGFWSGCFKFENIIWDGDSPGWNKPRTGGLKQGGTYWYYYRLNDEVEAYDDSKVYTTTCPLLPGQPMNVIEVPVEVHEAPPRARSVSMDVAVTIGNLPNTHTLDPDDKFNPLDPPPISKVHERCLSDFALNGRLEGKAQALRSMESIPSPPESPVRESACNLPPATDRAPPRYYNEPAMGRSSFNSQRSWHSSTPSYSHSSVYDEYNHHTSPFDLTPVLEFPSSRPGSNESRVEDTQLSFGVQSNSSGSWVEDVEPWVLQSDPTVPEEPSTLIASERSWLDCNSSQAPRAWTPYAHWSTHDLQMQGHFSDVWTLPETVSPREVDSTARRPNTSHGYGLTILWHLWPTNDLKEAGHFGDKWQLPEEASEEDEGEDYDQHQERAETDAFDVLSPSFSAATISSVGLGTPYRLSVGPSGTASSYNQAHHHDDDSSIHEVAERLRSLSAEDLDRRQQIYQSEERALSTYTLPQADETPGQVSEAHSKVLSPAPTAPLDVTLPSIMQQTISGSLEDDIFSALSF